MIPGTEADHKLALGTSEEENNDTSDQDDDNVGNNDDDDDDDRTKMNATNINSDENSLMQPLNSDDQDDNTLIQTQRHIRIIKQD